MNSKPTVSLLIAVRNEAEFIANCINSLLIQDYPEEKMEILILDGLSTDGTKYKVEELIRSQPYCRILDNPRKIQSAAWNTGIQESQGEIISIVSGHSEFSPDYVSQAVDTLLRTGADLVGGTVRARSNSLIGETIALAMSTPFGVGGARFRYTHEEEQTDTVFMGFCHRSLYEKIGGYDEELVRNQDDEFSYRLLKSGGRIICNPKIVSFYYSRSTISSLAKQYYQYGYWKVRVLQKHPRQMRMRQFVPPVFVASLLAALILALLGVPGRWLLAGLGLAYLAANLAASLLTAARAGWRHLQLLPLIFAILHVSYGLGFLVGLVRFAGRWGDKQGKVPSFTFPQEA